MPATAFGELAQFSSESLLITARKTHGDSVRKKKLQAGSGGPFDNPTRLHLLYIALDSEAQLTVRHMFQDGVNPFTLKAAEDALFKEAKENVELNKPAPNLKSMGFASIIFDNPAFFTLVADEDGWEFYFPAPQKEGEVIDGETHDPVVFIAEKTVITASSPNGSSLTFNKQKFEENFAFGQASKSTISGRDALRMINFFTDKTGNFVQTHVPYGFEINLRIPSAKSGPEHLTTIIIDPDGQNQGPPD